jgi:hypothetical protein
MRSEDAPLHDKKSYATPRLTIHGTVEQITHNVGTGAVDFPDGSQLQA